MSHYSPNEAHVRGDIFKQSGKWVETIALDMTGLYQEPDLNYAIDVAMLRAGRKLQPGYMLVVLEPHHQYSHPVFNTR